MFAAIFATALLLFIPWELNRPQLLIDIKMPTRSVRPLLSHHASDRRAIKWHALANCAAQETCQMSTELVR